MPDLRYREDSLIRFHRKGTTTKGMSKSLVERERHRYTVDGRGLSGARVDLPEGNEFGRGRNIITGSMGGDGGWGGGGGVEGRGDFRQLTLKREDLRKESSLNPLNILCTC